MPNIGSKGITRYEETFAVDNIGSPAADGLGWLVTADSGDTAIARGVAAGKGLHATGATTTTDNAMLEFVSDTLLFAGQEGHASVEVLFQLDVITNIAFFFGFSDTVADDTLTIPAELSTVTFTANAGTHIGFVYDVDATNDELHCHWANGGTKTSTAIANLRMVGMAPTAAKWLYMKVEMQDMGSGNPVKATFLAIDHTGKSVEKSYTTTVARSTALCYYLGIENRSATAHNVYIRGVAWEQTIADM